MGWTSSGDTTRTTPSYDPTTGRLPLPSMIVVTPSPHWTLTVAPAAGRRLPLPEGAADLGFFDPVPTAVGRDAAGALSPTRDGAVTRWRLDVRSGRPTPSEATTSPPASHLAVPAALAARLAPEVDRVVAGLADDRARAIALELWVSARARYALDARLDRRDPLGDFLFGTRAGHCEYFASALAVSLRLAGIPSRVIGGFHASLWNDTGRFWVVRRRDAHAWVEAFLPGAGWVRYDATPPAGRPTDTYAGALGTLARLRDALAFAWDQQVLGYDAERQRAVVTALRSGLLAAVARGTDHPLELTLLLGVAALAASAVWIRRRRGSGTQGPSRADRAAPRGGPVWFYDEALRLLAVRGWPRGAAETPRGFAARLAAAVPVPAGDALRSLTSAHEHTRFAAAPLPDPSEIADWLSAVRAVPKRPRREVDTRPIVP